MPFRIIGGGKKRFVGSELKSLTRQMGQALLFGEKYALAKRFYMNTGYSQATFESGNRRLLLASGFVSLEREDAIERRFIQQ